MNKGISIKKREADIIILFCNYCVSFIPKSEVEKVAFFFNRWLSTFLFLWIIVIFGCATKKDIRRQTPNWVSSGKHLDFPAPRYIQGMGMITSTKNPAADKQGADSNAFSEIIKQISANVSSEFSVKERADIQNNKETVSIAITSSSKVRSNMTISGLTIVDYYYDPDKKIYYSMAVLDRVSAMMPIEQKLLQHQKKFQEKLHSAMKERQTGQVFHSILSLREALHEAYKFQENLPSYQLLAGSNLFHNSKLASPPSSSVILNSLSEILSNLNFNIITGNYQKFVIGKPLNAPLTVQLILDDKKTKILAEGFQVDFSFQTGNGELTPYVTRTNKEGIASALISTIGRSPEQEYIVSAKISFSELLDDNNSGVLWNERIPANPIVKHFKIYRKKVKTSEKAFVFIKGSATSSGISFLIRDNLVKLLSEVGFSPLTASDIGKKKSQFLIKAIQNMQWKSIRKHIQENITLLIIGEVSISNINREYGFNTCSVNGLIKAINAKNGVIIAAKSFHDIAGIGATKAQAVDNAFKNTAHIVEPLINDLLALYEPDDKK